MRPVNIYALTRINRTDDIMRLERQMSGRSGFIKVKSWEIGDLRLLSEKLSSILNDPSLLDFYYSFIMPRLGKEFDLLRIGKDYIINLELKSRPVSDEAVKRQLIQNRHYLLALGINVYSYTFLRESGKLVRLSNSGHLVDADWEELAAAIKEQGPCYVGNIEELFREELYLISPVTDPGKFLRREYFLTWQQTDIKKKMIEKIKAAHNSPTPPIQGFTGYPGTGKTLLLYDMAMELSRKDRVCILHFGSHEKELEELDERLKRIDYYYCSGDDRIKIEKEYSCIFADEGHRIRKDALNSILEHSAKWKAPVIISYDREDDIHPLEREFEGAGLIEKLPSYNGYFLTNRIRLNNELSSFIRRLVHPGTGNHKIKYPSVSVFYSCSEEETCNQMAILKKEGYFYIYDEEFTSGALLSMFGSVISCIGAMEATSKEYDRVVMKIDDGFFYDESGFLRYKDPVTNEINACGRVRKLFHGLSRAKEKTALIVEANDILFSEILTILQP